MTDELQLLFIASKYRLSSDDTSILIELVQKDGIDWEHFFLIACRHKVFPRVWNNIAILAPSFIPHEIKEKNKALFRHHTLHCMATVGQLCSITSLLDKHDIVHVPYKGPVLACYLFDNFAMRSYGDLDILVSTVDLPRVYALLTANGYSPEVVLPEGQLAAYASVEDNLTFMSGQGVPIEIHWELSGRYLAKPIGLEDMLSRRLTFVVLQGRVFKVFSPEHHLLYLCLHGTKHCWAVLDLIACLAELLLKETEIDWELVFQVAEEHKCRRMLYIGLLLAQKVYCIELPDVVQTLVDEDKKALCWCAEIFDEIKAGAEKTGRNESVGQDMRFSLFRLQVRDSRLDAARYLLRMVFCPSKSEWKAFWLPSWFVIGYWFARPFRVLWSGVAGTIGGKWHNSR